MSAQILKLPVMTARPREVVVLPDQRFFVRSVGLVRDADSGSVREQLELALEGMAPFPVAQMLWGYWTTPAADHALVFAAYRKRFTTEETENWSEAEWVGPQLAVLLGEPAPPAATTWLVRTTEGLTAIHFGDDSGVPTDVRLAEVGSGAEEAEWQATADALVKSLGGSKSVQPIPSPTVTAGLPGTDELIVRIDTRESKIPLHQAQDLDVRDHDELVMRRRARIRDTWMWRALLVALLTIAFTGLAEISLIAGNSWRDGLHEQVQRQTPIVNEIETADRLANRIDELRTKRLRPFEMIAIVDGPRPETIIFLRTAATGLYSLEIEAETNDAQAINAYVAALQDLGATEGVETLNLDQRGSRSSVRLLVRFMPSAFNVAAAEEVSG
jgi:hypothetical protein